MKTMIWVGGPVLGFAIVAAASYSVVAEPTAVARPAAEVKTVALKTDAVDVYPCCTAPETSTVAAEADHGEATACSHDGSKVAGTEAAACAHDDALAKDGPAVPPTVVAEAK
jgi:hypothetical protein